MRQFRRQANRGRGYHARLLAAARSLVKPRDSVLSILNQRFPAAAIPQRVPDLIRRCNLSLRTNENIPAPKSRYT